MNRENKKKNTKKGTIKNMPATIALPVNTVAG